MTGQAVRAGRAKASTRPRAAAARFLDAVVALLLGAGTFFLYRLTADATSIKQSSQPHFVLLAWAFLHGHLSVDPARAARLGDITPYAGHYYVSFPPMPALLLLPFVAAAGPGFNDRLFAMALGAVNVGLAYLLVRRASSPGFAGPGLPLGRIEAGVVALVLGFATVHYYAVVTGTVWYLAHIVAVTFLLLALLECLGQGRPLVVGLALAAAFLARPPCLFGAVFWLVLAVRQSTRWEVLFPRLVRLCLPLAIAVAVLLVQNEVRFGTPTDFGYLKMRVAPQLAPRLHTWGQFNAHFLPENLRALLSDSPLVTPINLRTWLGLLGGPAGLLRSFTTKGAAILPFPVKFDPWGTGLWAVSPVLAFALRPPRRVDLPLVIAAGLSTVIVALPDLLYYNTGWGQYGDRFLLDFAPFLLLLLAQGLRRPLAPLARILFGLLLVVSILSNFLGTRWFLGLPPY